MPALKTVYYTDPEGQTSAKQMFACDARDAVKRFPDQYSFAPKGAAPKAPEVPAVEATDEAEKLAGENGIDLADIKGSGQNGTILVGDVRAAIAARDADQG